MSLDLVPIAIGLAVALLVYWGVSDRLSRRLLGIGLGLIVLAWLPIVGAAVLDPRGAVVGNALGLGLLAWLGTAAGALLLIGGAMLAIVRKFRG